jgi:hypothetical protein
MLLIVSLVKSNSTFAAMIDATEQIVKSRWYEIARREGMSERDCEKISGAFAYEGFRLPAPRRIHTLR